MRVKETCACGSIFEVELQNLDDESAYQKMLMAVSEWRTNHTHPPIEHRMVDLTEKKR